MSHNDEKDDDWYERHEAEEEADRLRKEEHAPALSRDEFLAWRSPREGTTNPTRADSPLWPWLVRTRWSAFSANEIFKGPSPFDEGPMWCFNRFGMSETRLPDGRIVHIAGEHEDSYDPDFHIYNDVTVVGTDGEIAIYTYPRTGPTRSDPISRRWSPCIASTTPAHEPKKARSTATGI